MKSAILIVLIVLSVDSIRGWDWFTCTPKSNTSPGQGGDRTLTSCNKAIADHPNTGNAMDGSTCKIGGTPDIISFCNRCEEVADYQVKKGLETVDCAKLRADNSG